MKSWQVWRRKKQASTRSATVDVTVTGFRWVCGSRDPRFGAECSTSSETPRFTHTGVCRGTTFADLCPCDIKLRREWPDSGLLLHKQVNCLLVSGNYGRKSEQEAACVNERSRLLSGGVFWSINHCNIKMPPNKNSRWSEQGSSLPHKFKRRWIGKGYVHFCFKHVHLKLSINGGRHGFWGLVKVAIPELFLPLLQTHLQSIEWGRIEVKFSILSSYVINARSGGTEKTPIAF